jgi:hypothetical protein
VGKKSIKRKPASHGKHPGGRPPKYDPDIHPVLAKILAKQGLSGEAIAKAMTIGQTTFHCWQKRYQEFRKALADGKTWPDDMVEASLFQRAIGYSHPAIKIMTVGGRVRQVPYIEHFAPDTGAAEFWLTNRRPKDWRHKQEITGANGGPLTILFAKELQGV